MELSDSIQSLKGIGKSRAALFANLGIQTVYDLLTYFPRTYEDRTKIVPIAELEPDIPACFIAMVTTPARISYPRKGMDVTRLRVADKTGSCALTFFNRRYVGQQLQAGQVYLFYGARSSNYSGCTVTNPIIEDPSKPGVQTRRIIPIYSLTTGVSNRLISQTILQVLDLAKEIPEVLSVKLRKKYGLCDAQTAYRTLHNPASFEELEQAKRRLAFEEFFIFSAGISILRARRIQQIRPAFERVDLTDFYAALPFRLTSAQLRVIEEIQQDFCRTTAMHRLLQGDVGCGKTMVAAAGIVCAARNHVQSALMAPTEILAEQHYQSLAPLLQPLGIQCGLLTGSMKASEKKQVRAALEDGSLDLVIGTHALLSETTTFVNLGFVITDEQHRFGVDQRALLSQKGKIPHLLFMSATPIPRTLSMVLYGDMDVSVIDMIPPGRQKVDTFLVGEDMRARINAFIRKQTDAGHQCFIVCPAIEESDTESLKSAELWAQTLQQRVFPDLKVALLHGKMKGAEKDAVMSAFAAGEYQILVSTTVIEVGVDVPNANLIIIENADRFGLSQLHQLRGRVGRGNVKSYCVLFSSNRSADTIQRLKSLCQTNNGFEIAESDLQQRGPGDLFGKRQHGLPVFKCVGLSSDLSILKTAQEAAHDYFSDPDSQDDAEFSAIWDRLHLLFENGGDLFS